jgi:signal peptidase I
MSEHNNHPALEDTEDLGFLGTQLYESMTPGAGENSADMSETRVLETMTVSGKEDRRSRKEPEEEEEKSWADSAAGEVLLFFRDLGICMALVLVIINFVIRPIQVEGNSMYPTLQNGSLGVSNLLGYNLDGVKRFDVVIVYLEENKKYLVKRCVGLPNETVAYIDGRLYIDGEYVEENFLDQNYRDSYEGGFMEDVAPVTLGPDEYYCIGDNRPHSTDSRYYGPFKEDKILSKGVFIFYPFSAFGAETW